MTREAERDTYRRQQRDTYCQLVAFGGAALLAAVAGVAFLAPGDSRRPPTPSNASSGRAWSR